MKKLELRPRQDALMEKLAEAFRKGHRNVMVCAPCGFGKTECATAMLLKTKENGKRGAFVCDRLSLLSQTGERFDRYGLDFGVMQSSHWRHRPQEKIQLCSIQTINRRNWPDAELYIHDEAHILSSGAKQQLAKRKGFSVGLSATPITAGLGVYFDSIITAATTSELIEDGALVPYRIFAPSEPDMAGVAIKNGEWEESESAKRCMPIIGDVVQTYLQNVSGKKFIAFAVNVDHAQELQRQFLSAGIITELYTYKQGDAERENTLKEFKKEDSYIRGLISVESLTRGFDQTDVEVMICARPLRKALHVFIQMVGRVLRNSPNKESAQIFDHAGNYLRFFEPFNNYMENGVHELDNGEKKEKEQVQKEAKEKPPAKCPKCFHVHKSSPICPSCGFMYPPKQAVVHEAGELKEIGAKPLKTADKRQLYAELKWIAQQRNWSEGALAHKFRDIAGTWPNAYKDEPPCEASQQTLNKVKSLNIAFAKSQKFKLINIMAK